MDRPTCSPSRSCRRRPIPPTRGRIPPPPAVRAGQPGRHLVPASPPWYRIATDRGVLARAALTSLGVGTLLTLVNYGEAIQAGTMGPESALPIAVTYVAPLLVALLSCAIALRLGRRA